MIVAEKIFFAYDRGRTSEERCVFMLTKKQLMDEKREQLTPGKKANMKQQCLF